MRGFSMGGAACWQFAVHYPEPVGRRRAGRRLLRDRRLPQGLPERDGPADLVREEALAPVRLHRLRRQPLQLPDRRLQRREGRPEAGRRHDGQGAEGRRASTLVHIIGPNTGHHYTPEAKDEINRRIDAIVEAGRDPVPHARAVHHLDAPLQPLVLGADRRPGEALGAGHGRRGAVGRRRAQRPAIRDARTSPPSRSRSLRPGRLSRCELAGHPSVEIDRRQNCRGPPGRSPTARGRPTSARSTASGSRSPRTTTAPCASGTACKGRSTTPSWTAS